MKLIIEIYYDAFDLKLFNLDKLEEYYNLYYKDNGLLFDKEREVIYYETEVSIMPIEGQRISCILGGFYIVDWACLCLDDTEEEYFNKSRIVIKEE